MRDDGHWWYDQHVGVGTTTDPSVNADMISPAFWLVSGREFKITRSDDSSHAPLLQTTGNCLGGQTFRSKITSYGVFRYRKVWSSYRCLGNCTVKYGGQYKTTEGFKQAECNGSLATSNKISFWCHYSKDASVMMQYKIFLRCLHFIQLNVSTLADSLQERIKLSWSSYIVKYERWSKFQLLLCEQFGVMLDV